MSIDNDTRATDYYDYTDPARMVEHEVPTRPMGDLFNTIRLLEEEDPEPV